MAIGTPVNLGTVNEKVADTSVVITTGAAVPAGSFIAVAVAWDAAVTLNSVSDPTNGSYTRAVENIANADRLVAIYYKENATLASGSAITITFSGNTNKAASALYATGVATSSALDQTQNASGSSATPSSGSTLSVLHSDELLVLGALATEGAIGDSFTQDAGFATPFNRDGTTGGGAASNVTVAGGYLISAYTGFSRSFSYSPDITSRDWAAAIATFKAGAAGLSATVNQAIETDAAQAVSWNPKRRLVGQISEVDLAQAITRRKTVAVGLVTESGLAQALTRVKRRALGQVTEADLAQAIAWAPKIRQLGQVAEADAAQALTSAKARSIGQTTEADTAMALVSAKAKALGQTSETDLAQTVARLGRVIDVAQTAEVDSAQAVAWAPKHRFIDLALEIDTAQAVARLKAKQLGQAAQSDLAQAIARLKRVALGQALEADAALALTSRKLATIAAATEMDTSQAVSGRKALAVAQAFESDSALALAAQKLAAVAQATEVDLAQAITATLAAITAPGTLTISETARGSVTLTDAGRGSVAASDAARGSVALADAGLGSVTVSDTGRGSLTITGG